MFPRLCRRGTIETLFFVRGVSVKAADRRPHSLDSLVSAMNELGLQLPPEALNRADDGFSELAARCLDAAVRQSGNPGIGFVLGMRAPIEWNSPLMYLLMSSPNLAHGIANLTRYLPLVEQRESRMVTDNSDDHRTTYYLGSDNNSRPFKEFAAVMFIRLLRFLASDSSFRPVEVRFVHAQPHEGPYQRPEYQQVFGEQVLCEQPRAALVFSNEQLTRPSRYACPPLHQIHEEQLSKTLTETLQSTDSILPKLRAAIFARLARGSLDIESVAGDLGLSVRTLQRRLAASGSDFQSLVDERRRRQALEHLDRPELSISQVARLSGFSDDRAFYRAFQRWLGMTPTAYRKQQKDKSPQ